MSCTLDHVGIVVSNMEEAIRLYGDILGVTPWKKGVAKLTHDGVLQTQLRIGDKYIEFLAPMLDENCRESNPATQFLKEHGEGLFHLSIFVDDFDKRISALKEKGFAVKEEEVVGDLFPGYKIRIAWLQPEETRGVRIEFVDTSALPEYYKTL